MDDLPSPSDTSSRSRRASNAASKAQPVPPFPRHVQFRRESQPALDMNSPPRNSVSIPGSRRTSKSLDMLKEENGQNEQSPLLAPKRSEDVPSVPPLAGVMSPDHDDLWEDGLDSKPETKSSWYLILLTLSIGGLQIAWSVELSNGSPYLLGLGISKSLLALVWIAGPLSGTLVQPYVGIKSDRSRSRFGKRRPFMIGGALATIVSLMLLAWTRELISGFLGIFGVAEDSQGTKVTSIVFAILMIYVLDFSINVIQAGIRAFIVDNAPMHQQDSANAWASRMTGVGNIIGYMFGYVDLPRYFWFLGDTQFKVLCVVASLAMIITLTISCSTVKERDPRLEGEPAPQLGGVIAFFKGLYHSIRRLPPQISKVCQVQFFAWIGWFPFLFYITTYIGEIYVEPFFEENPHMTPAEIDATWERATRIGTFALLIFAFTTFASSVIMPLLVAKSYQPPEPQTRTPMTPGAVTPRTSGAATDSSDYFTSRPASLKTTLTPTRLRAFSPHIPWLTLRRAWLISHILFTLLTWSTLFVRTTTGATILVALIGIPWSITNWAPFALISAEISKRDNIRRGVIRPPPTHDGELLARGEDPSEGADQAGVVLGIHNVAIAAPQVIATVVSSAIFKALQKPRGSTGDESVAWVLRCGGVAALVAAWAAKRVGEEGR